MKPLSVKNLYRSKVIGSLDKRFYRARLPYLYHLLDNSEGCSADYINLLLFYYIRGLLEYAGGFLLGLYNDIGCEVHFNEKCYFYPSIECHTIFIWNQSAGLVSVKDLFLGRAVVKELCTLERKRFGYSILDKYFNYD